MKLHSITLRNYRGVEDRRIEFGNGITVVSGPNEAGKSSIAEALRYLRTELDSAKKQTIKDLKPVHLDVGPEVTVMLTTGSYELTYRKRWLKRPETTLHIESPKAEQLSGREAHDRFLNILAETLDTDLFEALESRQGESLAQPQLAHLRALRQSLGEAQTKASDDELLNRVEQEFLQYFTPTGRPTRSYRALQEEIPLLEAQVAALSARSDETQCFAEEHARLEQEITRLLAERVESEKEVRQWEQKVDQLQGLVKDASDAAARLESARQVHDRAQHDLKQRKEDAAGIEMQAKVAEAQRAERQQMDDERLAAEQTFTTLARAADEAAKAADIARLTEREAQRAVQVARDRAAQCTLSQRVADAEAADARRREAASMLAANPIIDDDILELTDLDAACKAADLAREAAASVVTVEALGNELVSVGLEPIRGGERRKQSVMEELTVEVPGIIRVRVEPAASPKVLHERWIAAHKAREACLQRLGVSTVAQARTGAQRHQDAKRNLERAEEALQHHLAGETLETLRDELARLAVAIAGACPDDRSLLYLQALAQTCELERLEAEESARDAEMVRNEAHNRFEAARERYQRAATSWQVQEASLAQCTERLNRARADADDDALVAAVVRAQEAVEEATGMKAAATAALEASNLAAVQAWLGNARRNEQSVREQLDQAKMQRAKLDGLLDDRAQEGLFNQLAEKQADLDAASSQLVKLTRRARAVEMLRQTLHTHRDIAQARYVVPFRERLEILGQIVFGASFRVDIDDDLRIVSRTLRGCTIAFEQLSGGAQEQLALLGRLACAQLIDPVQGAPLIIDDALGFTDPQRLRALGVAFDRIEHEAQIIVLTCQPERYSSFSKTKWVRL